jgi:hypothetical protein
MRLPSETRHEIASYLPTTDFFRLRLISRGFYDIFWCQSFWKTRFWPDAERGFLFEFRHMKGPRDWRALYRRTITSRLPPGLQNKKRVWKLARALKDILDLEWMDTPSVPSLESTKEPDLGWKKVAGQLLDDRRPMADERDSPFEDGCHEFKKRRISVPHGLARIAVYLVPDGDARCISGFRFIASDEREICLGYRSNEQVSIDTPDLRGFIVAVRSKGINGLRIVTATGSVTPWIGSHDRCPKSTRLVTKEPVRMLEAGFDVSWVLLAICYFFLLESNCFLF